MNSSQNWNDTRAPSVDTLSHSDLASAEQKSKSCTVEQDAQLVVDW